LKTPADPVLKYLFLLSEYIGSTKQPYQELIFQLNKRWVENRWMEKWGYLINVRLQASGEAGKKSRVLLLPVNVLIFIKHQLCYQETIDWT